MIFDFSAFTEVERMRGDDIYICQYTEVRSESYKYGVEPSPKLIKTKVPGYGINTKETEGVVLGGDRRIDAGYYIYLNVAAGFDPKLITNNSYCLINNMALLELRFLEEVRHYGRVFYYIYHGDETTDSKRLFDKSF